MSCFCTRPQEVHYLSGPIPIVRSDRMTPSAKGNCLYKYRTAAAMEPRMIVLGISFF